jgi:hypothetical protein
VESIPDNDIAGRELLAYMNTFCLSDSTWSPVRLLNSERRDAERPGIGQQISSLKIRITLSIPGARPRTTQLWLAEKCNSFAGEREFVFATALH